MPYYNLLVVRTGKVLSAAAGNREHALNLFGTELECKLTLEGQDSAPPYLLDEWTTSPHWINPNIPVFES